MGARFSRILLKLSGEMLGAADGRGLDDAAVQALAAEIADTLEEQVQLAVVLGAGNLCRGAGPNRSRLGTTRQRLDAMGMLATVINTIALDDALARLGVRTAHFTSLRGIPFARAFDPDAAQRLLCEGGVVLLSGGTGLPYFSTDTAACVRALQVDAKALFKATQVDGVYDRDPREQGAVLLPHLSYRDLLDRGLAIMDGPAVALCAEHGLPIIVFNGHGKGKLRAAVAGNLTCSQVDDNQERR